MIHLKHQVLFSLKNNEKIFMNVVCCSLDWRFKGLNICFKIFLELPHWGSSVNILKHICSIQKIRKISFSEPQNFAESFAV